MQHIKIDKWCIHCQSLLIDSYRVLLWGHIKLAIENHWKKTISREISGLDGVWGHCALCRTRPIQLPPGPLRPLWYGGIRILNPTLCLMYILGKRFRLIAAYLNEEHRNMRHQQEKTYAYLLHTCASNLSFSWNKRCGSSASYSWGLGWSPWIYRNKVGGWSK